MSEAIVFNPYATYTIRDLEQNWFTYSGVSFFNASKNKWCTLPTMHSAREKAMFHCDYNSRTDEHERYVREVFIPACAHRWESSPVYEKNFFWERLEAVVLDQLEIEFSQRKVFCSTLAYDATFRDTPMWKRWGQKDRSRAFVDFVISLYDRSRWGVSRDFLYELAYVIAVRYLNNSVQCSDDRQTVLIANLLSYGLNADHHTKNLVDILRHAELPQDEFETIIQNVDERFWDTYHDMADDKKDDMKAFTVINVREQCRSTLSEAVHRAASVSGQTHIVLGPHIVEKCLKTNVDDSYAERVSTFWHRSYADDIAMTLIAMYFLKYDSDVKDRVKKSVLGIIREMNENPSSVLDNSVQRWIVKMGYRVEDIMVEYA